MTCKLIPAVVLAASVLSGGVAFAAPPPPGPGAPGAYAAAPASRPGAEA